MYFRRGASEDPPIYYFGEGGDQDTIRELYPSFNAFLLTEIAGHARLHAQAEQARAAGRPWTCHHFGEMGDGGTGGNGSSTEGSGE
jgi:hypothetical protein